MHLHGWLPRAGILEGIWGHPPHSPMGLLSSLAEHLREVEIHKTLLDSHLISLIYNITNKAVWLFSLKASGCVGTSKCFIKCVSKFLWKYLESLIQRLSSYEKQLSSWPIILIHFYPKAVSVLSNLSVPSSNSHSHCCVLDTLILGEGWNREYG